MFLKENHFHISPMSSWVSNSKYSHIQILSVYIWIANICIVLDPIFNREYFEVLANVVKMPILSHRDLVFSCIFLQFA